MNPTNLKALIGVLFVLAGAIGLISPDDSSNEELIDSISASVGAVVLLFTQRIDRKPDPPAT